MGPRALPVLILDVEDAPKAGYPNEPGRVRERVQVGAVI